MRKLYGKLHIISEKLWLPSLPNWLSVLLASTLILRIPSFFEPYYYGDEMIYLTLGQAMRMGIPLYSGIHDNKPPLLYMTAAVAGNLFWFKVILAFWNVVTIILFHKLSKKLFEGNEKAQKVSTLIFAFLTTLPLLEGLTANSELFMILFTIIAVLIVLGKTVTPKRIFLAGVLFGIGALYKIPAAFDLPAIVVFWAITRGLKDWKKIFVDTVLLGLGFLAPILLTFVWYFFQGALPEYIKAAFLQNVGYLSSFRPGDVQKPFLVKNGPLLTRALVVFLGSGIVYIFRNKLSKRFILVSVWLLFALFAITLSERPYPHYFIQAMAPISILFGIFFADKSLEQSLAVIPLSVALFVPVFYKFWFYPTTSYYLRFINFAVQRTTREQYFNGFATNVSRDYQIAEFLRTSSTPKDRVFMWDPASPSVYALSRRMPPIKYVVDYHINDYSTKAIEAKNIATAKPKFIILTSKYPYIELAGLIKSNYILINRIGDANIYSRIDFAPEK